MACTSFPRLAQSSAPGRNIQAHCGQGVGLDFRQVRSLSRSPVPSPAWPCWRRTFQMRKHTPLGAVTTMGLGAQSHPQDEPTSSTLTSPNQHCTEGHKAVTPELTSAQSLAHYDQSLGIRKECEVAQSTQPHPSPLVPQASSAAACSKAHCQDPPEKKKIKKETPRKKKARKESRCHLLPEVFPGAVVHRERARPGLPAPSTLSHHCLTGFRRVTLTGPHSFIPQGLRSGASGARDTHAHPGQADKPHRETLNG